ncbi:MAG: HAMP domain-containing protein [Deltaproteobacteria bacterium]|nr:HAMP domain-containing protein [Deltaproteobacteria bacterium]
MRRLKDVMGVLKLQHLRIRTRLLAAGVLLGALAAANPLFVRHHTRLLSEFHAARDAAWNLRHAIQDLNRGLAKAEAYLESPDTAALRRLDALTGQVTAGAGKYDVSASNALAVQYGVWRERARLAPTQERRNAVLQVSHLSEGIDRTIRVKEEESEGRLAKYIRRVKRASIMAGGLVFLGFTAFVLSLWFTLLPDLAALIAATREFKLGNLNHRADVPAGTETAELAAAFNEMAESIKERTEKLDETHRQKSDFVSTVSHELRTPLTSIKGSLGLILGGVTGAVPQEVARMLKITEKNTNRLIRLVDDVLDIAKIEAGAIRLKFDKHSIADVLSHAVQGVDSLARAREVNLTCDWPENSALVVVDRDRIEQVLMNLLSNAIKFTEAGGTVHVYCENEVADGGGTGAQSRVLVHVEDTGRGIPAEFMEQLFEKFHQAESSVNHAQEGTGLGLAIAKGLVEEHGGKIWATSVAGAGSRFTFSIPWNGTEFAEVRRKDVA